MIFFIWIFWLGILFVNYINILTCTYSLFICIDILDSIVWIYHNLFTCFPADKHLGSFCWKLLLIAIFWAYWNLFFSEHVYAFLLGANLGM